KMPLGWFLFSNVKIAAGKMVYLSTTPWMDGRTDGRADGRAGGQALIWTSKSKTFLSAQLLLQHNRTEQHPVYCSQKSTNLSLSLCHSGTSKKDNEKFNFNALLVPYCTIFTNGFNWSKPSTVF
ncbi:hypothetical protein XENOCAPTIV_001773, partial [Xenoophorus captivus]